MGMANFLNWLIPREKIFYELIEAHSSKTLEVVEAMDTMVRTGEKKCDAAFVEKLEEEADMCRLNLLKELEKSMMTPMDAEDIIELSGMIDDIADYAEDVAYHFCAYKTKETPPQTRKSIIKLSGLVLKSTQNIDNAVKNLWNNPNETLDFCMRAKTMESQGDEILRTSLPKLYSLKPQEVFVFLKNKEILEMLENALDKCEDVAEAIGALVVELR